MRKLLLSILILCLTLSVYANSVDCKSTIKGYRVVKNSIHKFSIDKNEACFFAFYTPNPDPVMGLHGDGNLGETLWYGYYMKKNPSKIYEFPKPNDPFWSIVCTLNSVSFHDMNGDRIPDVTVIGSCDGNAHNNTYPFVFIRKGDHYIINDYLFGFVALSVADVRALIASPKTYYDYFEHRFDPD